MNESALTGTWKLVSFELRTGSAQAGHPFGEQPIGHIIYSADGHFAVTIMSAGRARFAAGDLFEGSAEEKSAAMETCLAYAGTFEVEEGRVVHHVAVSLFPNWAGTDQVRYFELAGDRLILSTPPILAGGGERTARLTLKRVERR
jgi:hypothetical protein